MATSWEPSSSSAPTLRKTLILPGARACTMVVPGSAVMHPTYRARLGRPTGPSAAGDGEVLLDGELLAARCRCDAGRFEARGGRRRVAEHGSEGLTQHL